MAVALFSAKLGSNAPAAAARPCQPVVLRSDPDKDKAHYAAFLRQKWPTECKDIQLPIDVSRYFDDQDLQVQGHTFLYTVLEQLANQNRAFAKHVQNFSFKWSSESKRFEHVRDDMSHKVLFSKEERAQHSDEFLSAVMTELKVLRVKQMAGELRRRRDNQAFGHHNHKLERKRTAETGQQLQLLVQNGLETSQLEIQQKQDDYRENAFTHRTHSFDTIQADWGAAHGSRQENHHKAPPKSSYSASPPTATISNVKISCGTVSCLPDTSGPPVQPTHGGIPHNGIMPSGQEMGLPLHQKFIRGLPQSGPVHHPRMTTSQEHGFHTRSLTAGSTRATLRRYHGSADRPAFFDQDGYRPPSYHTYHGPSPGVNKQHLDFNQPPHSSRGRGHNRPHHPSWDHSRVDPMILGGVIMDQHLVRQGVPNEQVIRQDIMTQNRPYMDVHFQPQPIQLTASYPGGALGISAQDPGYAVPSPDNSMVTGGTTTPVSDSYGSSYKATVDRSHEARANEMTLRTIFVGNLSEDMSEKELFELFAFIGGVEHSLIPKPPPGTPRKAFQYGFVRFSDVEKAHRAIEVMDGAYLHGQQLAVNRSRARRGQYDYVQRFSYNGPRQGPRSTQQDRPLSKETGESSKHAELSEKPKWQYQDGRAATVGHGASPRHKSSNKQRKEARGTSPSAKKSHGMTVASPIAAGELVANLTQIGSQPGSASLENAAASLGHQQIGESNGSWDPYNPTQAQFIGTKLHHQRGQLPAEWLPEDLDSMRNQEASCNATRSSAINVQYTAQDVRSLVGSPNNDFPSSNQLSAHPDHQHSTILISAQPGRLQPASTAHHLPFSSLDALPLNVQHQPFHGFSPQPQESTLPDQRTEQPTKVAQEHPHLRSHTKVSTGPLNHSSTVQSKMSPRQSSAKLSGNLSQSESNQDSHKPPQASSSGKKSYKGRKHKAKTLAEVGTARFASSLSAASCEVDSAGKRGMPQNPNSSSGKSGKGTGKAQAQVGEASSANQKENINSKVTITASSTSVKAIPATKVHTGRQSPPQKDKNVCVEPQPMVDSRKLRAKSDPAYNPFQILDTPKSVIHNSHKRASNGEGEVKSKKPVAEERIAQNTRPVTPIQQDCPKQAEGDDWSVVIKKNSPKRKASPSPTADALPKDGRDNHGHRRSSSSAASNTVIAANMPLRKGAARSGEKNQLPPAEIQVVIREEDFPELPPSPPRDIATGCTASQKKRSNNTRTPPPSDLSAILEMESLAGTKSSSGTPQRRLS